MLWTAFIKRITSFPSQCRSLVTTNDKYEHPDHGVLYLQTNMERSMASATDRSIQVSDQSRYELTAYEPV
jgi:hypothetical protein